MDVDNLYTKVDPLFYETITRYTINDTYKKVLKQLVPDSWLYKRKGVWLNVTNQDSTTPQQGFKIHISATVQNAERILKLVVPECVKKKINFKLAGDEELLTFLTSKFCNRSSAGKFMTIYPPEKQFTSFIEQIYQKTDEWDLKGPYIFSDARYKNSKIIHYRYGGFVSNEVLKIDGKKTEKIKNKDGKLVSDNRIPQYKLPEWVEDPFGNKQINKPKKNWVLHDRYTIEGAITFSNSGGVYTGKDKQTGKDVVIKEARPFTNVMANNGQFINAERLLRREYKILSLLNEVECTPQAIDLFNEWEHTFLVQEKVNGLLFYRFWAQPSTMLIPQIYDKARLKRVMPKFIDIALSLIINLSKIHDSGILIGDLSPSNILVDPETLDLKFIDFESAIQINEKDSLEPLAVKWSTPGYNHPGRDNRDTLHKKDDYYALGMNIFNGLIPVVKLLYLKPNAKELFLEKFISLGLPRETKTVIDYLLENQPSSACRVLNEMKKDYKELNLLHFGGHPVKP